MSGPRIIATGILTLLAHDGSLLAVNPNDPIDIRHVATTLKDEGRFADLIYLCFAMAAHAGLKIDGMSILDVPRATLLDIRQRLVSIQTRESFECVYKKLFPGRSALSVDRFIADFIMFINVYLYNVKVAV
jgi:hypothetical protein